MILISYVTVCNPTDSGAFGGRCMGAIDALRGAEARSQFVSGVKPAPTRLGHLKIKKLACSFLRLKHINVHRVVAFVQAFSTCIQRHLGRTRPDAVLSPISPGSQPTAYVHHAAPIVVWTDTTLAGAIDNDPEDANRLQSRNIREMAWRMREPP